MSCNQYSKVSYSCRAYVITWPIRALHWSGKKSFFWPWISSTLLKFCIRPFLFIFLYGSFFIYSNLHHTSPAPTPLFFYELQGMSSLCFMGDSLSFISYLRNLALAEILSLKSKLINNSFLWLKELLWKINVWKTWVLFTCLYWPLNLFDEIKISVLFYCKVSISLCWW